MTHSTRVSGALLLVVASLILASLACYSGQIPGVFELTPYYTPTPFPTPVESRLSVGDEAYAPQEPGRPFFYLTIYPEPLDNNVLNSKALCNGNSTATVLYAAGATDNSVFYLVNCVGSVGWVADERIAGPLQFERNNLALAIAPPGEQLVTMLDEFTLQPAPVFLQQCRGGSIVPVMDIKVADQDADGTKELFYQIDCPRGTRGYVESSQLLGPLEINVGDRALAVLGESDENETYQLAVEPGPVTADNTVEGTCVEGDVLVAEEARVVEEQVYYRMTCGDISGWASSDRFIGPFLFDAGQNAMVQVEPIASVRTEDDPPVEPVEGEEALVEEEAVTAPSDEPEIVYTLPPVFLTSAAGPAVFESEETETNVVGVCTDRSVVSISSYAGLSEQIYYEVTCMGCPADQVQTEQRPTIIDGMATVATISICPETQEVTGWLDQPTLRGPLPLIPGDRVTLAESSPAIQTTEEGETFVRLPTTTSGAFALTPSSQHIEFAGRCPIDSEFIVVDFATEESRTGTGLTLYFQVECTGQPASYEQVDQGGRTSTSAVSFDVNASETITGWVLARDLESAES